MRLTVLDVSRDQGHSLSPRSVGQVRQVDSPEKYSRSSAHHCPT